MYECRFDLHEHTMAEYSSMSTDSSWIDLLQRNGLTPVKSTKTSLRISESTPKVNSNQSKIREELVILRAEKERQSELLEKLTTDNSRLIDQVGRFRVANEKLEGELSEARLEHDRMAASLALAQLTATELEESIKEKDEALQSLLSHVQSLQDEVQQLSGLFQQQGNNKPLISDLERLTVHNAELCDRLAATQHSRTILEREVLSLKRKLLEEKTVNGRLDQLLVCSDRERTAMKEQLKRLVNTDQSSADLEALRKEKVELSEQVNERERELNELKETQVTQIEQQCREVESLKQQLEGQVVAMEGELASKGKEIATMKGELANVKEERRQLQEQLSKSQMLSQQLMAERHAYQQRMEQMSKQLESESNNSAKIHQQLEKTSTDLEASLGDVEASRIANMLLKQQVGDLEGQLDATKEQLKSRLELTNEMKALLDQRAQRIRQLEKTLSKKREELDISMETVSELLNASRDSEDTLSVSSSVVLSSSSPVHRVSSRTRFTSSQAEVVHLKQRLSESRQASVRLEMKLATLKTENAKLLGSQQALNAIREQLSQENSRLSNREREMDSHWQGERETLTNQLNSISAETQKLKSQLAQQKEQLMLRVEQLEEENHALSLQELSVESQARLEHIEREVWQLTSLLEEQNTWVHKQIELCKGETHSLQAEVREVEEGTRLTEAVNNATQVQLQKCESSVCELIGEVEILRARKTVLMKYTHEQLMPANADTLLEQNRKLERELADVRALLQQCSCSQLSRDQSCDQSQVSERGGLKWRLRCQTRQTNYCRVKLGYALSELRLYKELKVAMETHIAELQASVASLECRYDQCVQRLQQAEALGFIAEQNGHLATHDTGVYT